MAEPLVSRLRQFAVDIANGIEIGNVIVLDAISEIERLTRQYNDAGVRWAHDLAEAWNERDRLQSALKRIDVLAPEDPTPGSGVRLADISYRMGEIAREALKQPESEEAEHANRP